VAPKTLGFCRLDLPPTQPHPPIKILKVASC